MEMIKILPKDGRLIRLEDCTILPEEGKTVPKSTFINRKIKSGDVLVAEMAPEKKEVKFGANKK